MELDRGFGSLDLLAPDAMRSIAENALRATSSRHAIVAIFNEAEGCLEVTHAAGIKGHEAVGQKLEVDDALGIVSYVAATGQTYVSGDVTREPRYRKLFENTVSEAAAPILDRFGRIVGVLNVESDQRNAFGAVERETCKTLARFAAVVLELESRKSREDALIQVGQALSSALTEESLISMVTFVASEMLHFQAASIFVREPGTDDFVLRGSSSRLKNQIGQIKYSKGEGCTGWVCEKGEPIMLQNPQKDPRWRGLFLEFPGEQIDAFLCVPILIKGKSHGAIRILRRKAENPFLENRFTADDLALMESIAGQVASGLQNIRSVERMLRSERMVAWGELSAKSSHMIGNRVFALKGDINELQHLLKSKPENTPSLIELSKSLSTNVSRIEEILQDFRDFLSATQLQLALGNLNEIIQETVAEVFPKRTRVKLKMDLDPNLPEIMLDDKRLRRAISELIENSLPYASLGEAGKMISVSTRTMKVPENGSEWVELEVSDSGPGVAPENKTKIFEPFFTGRVKGMGLGLSIVKGIIESHGGSIAEHGQPGAGANFLIRLPVSDRS